MLAPLRINERPVGDTRLLELSGHLVFDEGDQILRDRVHALVDEGSRRILLDLHDVTYVDSGGIGAVVEMYLHLQRVGGRLALMRPGPCARRVLQITHLASALDVFEDEESAIRGIHMPATH
ncbi:MAG TPA: STAS domain-containing protein [Vicinamibacterales bacterium]|nr:STAS domain-containing protein [Vicinamibacterales bacterium]